MSKLISTFLLSLVALPSFGQQLESSATAAQPIDYGKKSRNQKTAAWVLAGAGTAGLLVTVLAEMTEVTVEGVWGAVAGEEVETTNYTAYYVASFATIGASVPLFMAAARNRRRAEGPAAYLKI